ncbi:hypothetical protein CONCODRAFT_121414 [Conidiobolus coronatus NRRL 28638]|uniref:Wbp11/ELF5/Saf1 N-terminal domain-containing protein n=1 Tax=Conidiobolus coronatus (strain ATCC 28846 / CBS 209.66 / NRRL 28638) TaxID=796925 RepID=A0A137PDI9_CONC2|nr:hypothetical protein CONCODRAFT_121414 [Conidiobolus coronatus NRRL 28638]|eukprot:KXN73032.1 hypothetical protein CONCODRAFT_121414 [Conidiobolus coronatus NRRL 28638]
MAKGKNNLSANPMDSFRKNQKKKDKNKTKEAKIQNKNEQLLTTDLKKFDMLVGKYRKLEREGQLDDTGKAKLEQVLKNRQKAIELKREKGLLKKGSGSASVTNLGHLGDAGDADDDEEQYEDYGQNSLGDHYLEELSSDDSESGDEDDESDHLDIEIEGEGKLSTVSKDKVESILPSTTKQSDKFSLPPLPSGPPPISAKIIPNPVPLPPKVQSKSKSKSSQKANPPFIPPHQPHMRPPYYGNNPQNPNQMHRPPPPPYRPTFQPRPAPPSALESSHYSSAPQLNNNPATQPKSALEVLAKQDSDTAKEALVVAAEPKLRDLKKDLVAMVPATLKRKNMASKATVSQSITNTPLTTSSSSAPLKAFKPTINAAPTFSDDEDEDEAKLSASSKPSIPAQNSTQSKTQKEYEEFLKQMEGLL